MIRRRRVEAVGNGEGPEEPARLKLAAAVTDHLLEVHSEPIVDLATGRLAGIEALLFLPDRPAGVGHGPDLSASRVLLAEVGQLPELVEVNDWYLEQAGRELRGWEVDAGRGGGWSSASGPLFLSVKLDGRFIAQSEFLPTVKDAVRRAGVSPSRLLLSVDRSEGIERLWPQLQRLKSHGVRVAMEDFSSDPATTDLVARFPFDVVRLSAETVAGSGAASSLAGLVKHARHLGCQVIGEGVDQAHLAQWLSGAGCDLAVGSYVSQPFDRLRSDSVGA